MGDWKLLLNGSEKRGKLDATDQPVGGKVELYNLAADIGEKKESRGRTAREGQGTPSPARCGDQDSRRPRPKRGAPQSEGSSAPQGSLNFSNCRRPRWGNPSGDGRVVYTLRGYSAFDGSRICRLGGLLGLLFVLRSSMDLMTETMSPFGSRFQRLT